MSKELATALKATLISRDESHIRNGEPANVVDGLFAIAKALNRIATNMDALRTDHPLMGQTFDDIRQGLGEIADAINSHNGESHGPQTP